MSKRMILKLDGTLEQGFRVTVQIWEQGRLYPNEKDGVLSATPELAECLNQWLHSYRQQAGLARLTVHKVIVHAANPLEVFRQQAEELEKQFQNWLKSSSFYEIELWLREKINPKEIIQVLLRSEDRRLHHLPWHEWDFLNRYLQTDLAIVTALEPVERPKASLRSKVRMLAILGDRTGIDLNADQQLLNGLPQEEVELEFLLEPTRQQINDQLWDQDWDVLFFAGHSSTEENRGRIYINAEDSLTIKELKYGLERAIARGLQLAIFNSCDGLGLAYELEQLHLPQLIVMREPVPDCVAQEFLKSFISAYANGESLYAAERIARQRLQPFEQRFPCATWLPIICQNLAETPPSWQELAGGNSETNLELIERSAVGRSLEATSIPNNGLLKTSQALEAIITHTTPEENGLKQARIQPWRRLTIALLAGFVTSSVIMGVRSLGWLQAWELPVYDQMLRLQPIEAPDKRFLIITIDDQDIAYQQQQGWKKRWSLTDEALNRLLQKLKQANARVIGLDVTRDDGVNADQMDLAKQLKTTSNLYAICFVGTPGSHDSDIAPPPEIQPDRLGFSNIVKDRDGVVRRQILFADILPTSPCTTPYSLSTQLALNYLAKEGINPEYTPDKNLKLRQVVFHRLQAPIAGYSHSSLGGSQVLLNYRSHRSVSDFTDSVSLVDVLTNNVNLKVFEDRIVLIGVVTSTTGDDRFPTPYSTRSSSYEEMPGVLLHAHMASQIISAVLDQRPLILVPPLWIDSLWTLGWSVITGYLVVYTRRRINPGFIVGITLILLYGVCYVLLVQGYWLPLLPTGLSIVIVSSSVFLYLRQEVDRVPEKR
jgi:CHASE2 domain-containing sensor protein